MLNIKKRAIYFSILILILFDSTINFSFSWILKRLSSSSYFFFRLIFHFVLIFLFLIFFFFNFLLVSQIKLAKFPHEIFTECFVFKRWRQSKMKINAIQTQYYRSALFSRVAAEGKTFVDSVKILWASSECGKRETEERKYYEHVCIFFSSGAHFYFFSEGKEEGREKCFCYVFVLYSGLCVCGCCCFFFMLPSLSLLEKAFSKPPQLPTCIIKTKINIKEKK